jgi:tRNA wybutosine-synthesizing protein 3
MGSFDQRKKDVLKKADKSFIGSWDKKIVDLCNEINESDNFYTTSSCAGRIVLMIDEDKKGKGLFLKSWHDEISFEELKKELNLFLDEGSAKFKLEPPIIHVACRDLKSASEFLEFAKHAGFRRCGINTISNNIVLELNSTERLEFPVINNKEILVDDKFLKIIVDKSNFLLNRGWKKIENLRKF